MSLTLRGACYYGAGGRFEAFVSVREVNNNGNLVQVRRRCDDPQVLEVLRQLYELLVSGDEERKVGHYKVKKVQKEGLPPMVSIVCSGSTFTLIQAKNSSGSAQLVFRPPFSDNGDEQIIEDQDVEVGEEVE